MSKKTKLVNNKYVEEIINLKKNLLNLRFQKFSGQLEKTSEIKNAKKKIARLKFNLLKDNGEKNA